MKTISKMKYFLFGFVLFLMWTLFGWANVQARPLVGAIRWDVWVKWPAGARQLRYHSHLQLKQWRYRLPFYAKFLSDTSVQIESDTQEIMDQEIGYASGAGLDFWDFGWCHPKFTTVPDNYNRCLRLYLSSQHKSEIKFCITLFGYAMGPAKDWEATSDALINLFKEPTYVKVLKNRPLIYIFSIDWMEKSFAPWNESRKALDRLREKTLAAGLGSPYIVAKIWRGLENKDYINLLGFDALGFYSAIEGGKYEEKPYEDLCATNLNAWNASKEAGKKVIPTVNAGWDGRPLMVDEQEAKLYTNKSWYTTANPEEIVDNLQTGLDWVTDNPETAEANTVLIYAWNEISEGGWLVPTLTEGTARLDAIRKVLKKK